MPVGAAVECWIGVVNEQDRRVVRLAGRLGEAQVPDLLLACAADAVPVHLDLTELISIDSVGVETLHRLRASGVRLVAVPEYIHLKLESLARAETFRPRAVPNPAKPTE